jgi:hypothetical protein
MFRNLWQRREIRVGVWLTSLLCLAFVLLFITVYEPRHYTCLHCRAHKYERWLLGIRWSSASDTAFTPWYHSHYPAHDHAWVWTGGTEGRSIYGTTTYFACGRRHPVHELSPSCALKLAERAPEQFATFYRGITSPNEKDQEQAAREATLYAIKLQ